MMNNTEDIGYEFKKSLPNKLIQDDGTITDITGKEVTNPSEVYETKPALPNKFLNPDGSYSTLNEIIASMVDTDIFVIVDELPSEGDPQKIYIVPNGTGGFDEYRWTGTAWDNVGMIEFDVNNYYTKDQTDINFLKKDNTTAYTPSANYHPATKKYVDDNAVTFKPFPNSFVTNSTTQQFLNSIAAAHLTSGMAYLGQVSLSDMPDGVIVQAEVEVYIYPQNVVYCVMRSAEVSPYVWECNSYEYRGWEASSKVATDYADNNFLKKNNTTSFTPSGDYNPATKKYVDDAISTNITTVLGGSY